MVNVCKAVRDAYRAEGARRRAGAKPDAAVGAFVRAAASHAGRRKAVVNAEVFILSLYVGAAGAADESDGTLYIAGFNAHDAGNLLRDIGAACSALVERSAVSDDGRRVARAAGEAAAAAVSAGENAYDLLLPRVGFNGKYLGSVGEYESEHSAEDTEYQYRI